MKATAQEGSLVVGAMLMGKPEGYSVQVRTMDGKTLAFFEHTEERTADGRPIFRQLAVLDMPSLGNDETLVIGLLGPCAIDDVQDYEILAIVKRAKSPNCEPIVRAWRANRLTHQFEELPATRVCCRQFVAD